MAIDKKLKDRLSSMEKIRKDLATQEKSVSKDIMDTLKAMMVKNPLITAVMWRQYVPAFNDGDACEFSISGPFIKFNEKITGAGDNATSDENDEDYSSDDEWLDMDYDVDNDFYDKHTDILNFQEIKSLKASVKDVGVIMAHLLKLEDSLREMFGESTEIVVTKKGVETDDYYDE